MNKIAIIYWSQTGNTKLMAEQILVGAKTAGAEVDLFSVDEIASATALTYDVLALGCPAMGAEALEEMEFQPFFDELLPHLAGKKIALFGSYGWGTGEWMQTWQQEVIDSNAILYNQEGLIVNESPDEQGTEQCQNLGAALASF